MIGTRLGHKTLRKGRSSCKLLPYLSEVDLTGTICLQRFCKDVAEVLGTPVDFIFFLQWTGYVRRHWGMITKAD